MEYHGLTDEQLDMLEEYADKPLCNFFLLFIFFRDDPYVPILIWPKATIGEIIEAYAHKTVADIGAIYFFKENPKRIQELYDGYTSQMLTDDAIWTSHMCSSIMAGVEISKRGFPYISFYERNENGIFVERDGGDTALILMCLAGSTQDPVSADLWDDEDDLPLSSRLIS